MFHFRGRKVSRPEHMLPAVVGLALAILFTHALRDAHLCLLPPSA